MTFAKWMDRVENACKSESDRVIYILPSSRFRDAYSRGIAPEQFSERTLHRIRSAIRTCEDLRP